MGVIKEALIVFSATVFLVGCGVHLGETTGGGVGEPPKVKLSGHYVDLQGQTIELESLQNQTQVVIFAQDTCAVCSKEALELVAYAADKGAPKNIQLRHLLVGSVLQDAKDWVEFHKVPWAVGIADAELFKQYCPAKKVPCLLVFKPNQGLTFQHTGALTVTQIMEAAGQW